MIIIEPGAEPMFVSDELPSGSPAVLTFRAYSTTDDPVVYVIVWGDGSRSRGVVDGRMFRLQHTYDIPGSYSPVLQLVTPDDSLSRRLGITILPKREREKPLYRWVGPALKLATLGKYVASVEDSLAPILINPLRPAAEGAMTLVLPVGLVIEPKSHIQIVEGNKLVSGGNVLSSSVEDAGTVVNLDFSLNDNYTTGAQVQVIGRAVGYGRTNERAVTPDTGLRSAYDDELVKDSIGILFGTSPGERLMRPTFGTNLRELVFDMADPVTAYLGQAMVLEAITSFETRATLINPEVSITSDHEIRIKAPIKFNTGDTQVFDQSIPLNAHISNNE